MSENEVGMLYVDQAQKKEAQGKLKEAEKMYLAVNEPDLAINMYKKARQYRWTPQTCHSNPVAAAAVVVELQAKTAAGVALQARSLSLQAFW
jgi:hypothetical protein